MKKAIIFLGTIFFTSSILTSCGGNSNDKKEETKVDDSTRASVDSLKENSTINKVEPGQVSCNLFFETMDYTDEETGEVTKGGVAEKKDFNTKKTSTFCYDSEEFHHLTLNGTGKRLSFIINSGDEQVYIKENFDLTGTFTFTSEDFNFRIGAIYSIVIKENETIFFNGTIDSVGCM